MNTLHAANRADVPGQLTPDNTDTIDWPTTMRFSRFLGEAVHGADYAHAIDVNLEANRSTPVCLPLLGGIGLALCIVLANGTADTTDCAVANAVKSAREREPSPNPRHRRSSDLTDAEQSACEKSGRVAQNSNSKRL